MKNYRKRGLQIAVAVSSLLLISWLGGFINVENAAKFGVRIGDGTFFHFQGDEFYKMVQVVTVYRGYSFIGNPYTYEERLVPTAEAPYGICFLATMLRLFHIDVATSSYLLDFIVPIVTLLLTFILFSRLFPAVERSELFVVSFLFVLLFMMSPSQRDLMRYMQAQATMPLALYLMAAIFLLARNRLGTMEFAFVTLLSGCFVFADVWFPLLIVGFYLILMVSKFRRGELRAAGRFGFLILATVMIGSYEVLRIVSISRIPGFKMLEERVGAFNTFVPSYPIYIPYVSGLLLVTAALGRMKFFRLYRDIVKSCLTGLLFCSTIYFQNIITHRRLYFQGEHVSGMALLPSGMIVVVILLNLLSRTKSQAVRGTVLLALSIGASAYHMHVVRDVAAMHAPADTFDPISGYNPLWIQKNYRPAFDWLKKQGSDKAVVLADPALAPLVGLAAVKYSYCGQFAAYPSFDQAALVERYFPFLWLKPVLRTPTLPDPIWHMHEKIRDYDPRDYSVVYQSAGSALPHKLRTNAFFEKIGLAAPFSLDNVRGEVRNFQEHIDYLYGSYEAFTSGKILTGIRDLMKYRCDYVLWGPQERRFFPHYEPNADPTLKLKFRDETHDVAVYEVLRVKLIR